MSKTSDRNRILRPLRESEGLSNLRIKTDLDLADGRYSIVRNQLIEDGLVEKYVCRGGGIRLTPKGEKASPKSDVASSTTLNEAGLYAPLIQFLDEEAEGNELEVVCCPTHALKARGRWQNPDVTRIALEYYVNLRKIRVTVTTYEVKQFPNWTVSAVYEAASHHRFSHEAYVVLEWPNDAEFSITDPTYKLDQIARECQRFGVGLATLHKHYTSYRLKPRIDAVSSTPNDEDVEAWLEYVLSRNSRASSEYDVRMNRVQELATTGRNSKSTE